jgi:hypothetical protein
LQDLASGFEFKAQGAKKSRTGFPIRLFVD